MSFFLFYLPRNPLPPQTTIFFFDMGETSFRLRRDNYGKSREEERKKRERMG